MKIHGPPEPQLDIAHQLNDLRNLFPDGIGRLHCGVLIWKWKLRPSPLSREYQVRIDYRLGAFPTTRVVDPVPRELAGGRKPPHVYKGAGDPLCLFYPAAREWTESKLLSRTIVPWACEWLLHFEAWLFTGVWDGGGITHGMPDT